MKYKVIRSSRYKQLRLVYDNLGNILLGTTKYFLKHPIKSLPIFYARGKFSFWRTELSKDLKTPEGFSIKTDMDLLVYTCIFVENNLYYRPFIKELKALPSGFNIIDVGANAGFFSQWIGSYNLHGTFSCIEIWNENVKRGRDINKRLAIVWYNNAAHFECNREIEFNVGDLISMRKSTSNIRWKEKSISITVDSISEKKKSIFAIKIDTDGNNINVLEGAREALSKTRWLLIEIESGVREWMKLNAPGFKLMKQTAPEDLIYKNMMI